MVIYTNAQIAESKDLWEELYDTSAFPENRFENLTLSQRKKQLNRDYPE